MSYVSQNIINEIEKKNWSFDKKYNKLYKQYDELMEQYIHFEGKILNLDNNIFKENNEYLSEIAYNLIDEIRYVLNYIINMTNNEISTYLENDYKNIVTYNKKKNYVQYLSNKLYTIKTINVENYAKEMILDSIILYKKTDYYYDEIMDYLEKNSKKGNYIILSKLFLNKITKSKKLDISCINILNEKWNELTKISERAYNVFDEIIKKLLNNNIIYLDERYIYECYDYLYQLNNYDVKKLLEEHKEPENNYDNMNECPICLLEIKEKCLTKCGHSFCVNCIRIYLENMGTFCPICKTDF